jgi:hypothetical protein
MSKIVLKTGRRKASVSRAAVRKAVLKAYSKKLSAHTFKNGSPVRKISTKAVALTSQ